MGKIVVLALFCFNKLSVFYEIFQIYKSQPLETLFLILPTKSQGYTLLKHIATDYLKTIVGGFALYQVDL